MRAGQGLAESSRRWGICLMLALCLPFSIPVQAQTEFTVQLRWYHQFQFAGYYMAKEQGFYEEAGLSVRLLEGGPQALTPVAATLSGEVDLAISNSGVLIHHMEGDPVVALAAITQTSPIVWIVLEGSGIQHPEDMSGKRLMLMPPPESAELLAMLVDRGVSISDVELLPTSLDLMDLLSGEVDAYDGYSTNEPFYLDDMGVDYHLIRPRDYGINFYNDVLITRQDLLDEKHAEVDAFLQATLKGWQYALDNVEESITHIREHYAPEKSEEHLRFEAIGLRELILPDLVEVGHMNPERWRKIGEKYRDLGMVEGEVSLDNFLYQGPPSVNIGLFYRVAGVSALVLLIVGLMAMRYAHLNHRLMREATRRKEVERRLRDKQEALYQLANTDSLTGAWNRLKFESVAQAEINRSQRYDYPLALIFLDLDHFKRINDEQGHKAGDEALKWLTEKVATVLRDSDSFCRWGGEEFLVLAPHADEAQALALAEKLRLAIAGEEAPGRLALTISLGVAVRNNEDDLEPLLGRADQALYQAKAAGRNQVALAP